MTSAPATMAVPAVSADGTNGHAAEHGRHQRRCRGCLPSWPTIARPSRPCEDRLFADLVKSYKGKSVKFVGVCCFEPEHGKTKTGSPP